MAGRESNEQKSLVDFSPEGGKELDMSEATEHARTFTAYKLNNCTPFPIWN